jgi:hypothetical protein
MRRRESESQLSSQRYVRYCLLSVYCRGTRNCDRTNAMD